MNLLKVDGCHRAAQVLLDAVLPEGCQLCAEPVRGIPICAGCRDDLPWISTACPRCGRPVPWPTTCGSCLSQPPPWQAAVVPFAWGFPVDRLVGRFKYAGALHHGRLLGMLLAGAVAGRAVDALVPVPLHPARLAERGYNQAAEIARPVGRRLGVPVRASLCRRVRATPAQAGLPADVRRGNPAGAFSAARGCDGLHLAVVDDVLTTGATAAAVTRCLRRAGAAGVEVWAVARGGTRTAGGPT